MLELLEDIQELRPTIFSSVPRLWNRIYDKVMAQVCVGVGGWVGVSLRRRSAVGMHILLVVLVLLSVHV